MPCYEPKMEWEERLTEFLTAALCHLSKKVSSEDLESFPGLAEWKNRHSVADSEDTESSKFIKLLAYDRANGGGGYEPPLFMAQYMKKVQK